MPSVRPRTTEPPFGVRGLIESARPNSRWPELSRSIFTASGVAACVLAAVGSLQTSHAQNNVPKQVELIVDADRLVASNVRFSRFDDFKLNAREDLAETAVGQAVIVVVTNQRIIAYGVVSGWRSIDRIPNERIERIEAEDYAGLVVTTQRLLNFNGQTGVWGERKRRVSR
jgi:hypothetical protein